MSANNVEMTAELIAAHGLSEDEFAQIVRLINRQPNLTELGIFSAMWNEHCSYKSSRVWLRTLPTDGPQVVCGPGENAGIVDIGDGQVAVFKMESHNHPSFIEPYQGAATGVGGIMRDIFTMGARPVANLNALRFGDPAHPKTRHLVSGVVAGIGGYGNCIGVPTVGGEVNFDAGYNGNILVNAMCVGVADADKVFYSAASGIGNPVVYVGSKTGRDGIHGASMASAEFDDKSEEKRPTVQVGDPFTEKLLLEACLELMAGDAVIAIQDMGAAGLTCSAVEMASKGGLGLLLDLDKVPCRETGMSAYEMMLSESQERMLMVLHPDRTEAAREIFDRWELDFAIIGETTDTRRFVIQHGGAIVADLPVDVLAEDAPVYQRPWTPTPAAPAIGSDAVAAPDDLAATIVKLVGGPHLCSRRWVWEQYDHMVMGDTVQRPGGDAAVVRVHGTRKGLAATTDVTPRYCLADPKEGGKQAIAEAYRNLSAVGAKPLATTDCLNFGNPEKPETMGQFVGCIEGIGEACRALDMPIVSGNVSLYNETNGVAIPPTPAIGAIGLIDDIAQMTTIGLRDDGDLLFIIGETRGHLGQSLYAREIANVTEGAPPPVDLATEKRHGEFVRAQITAGQVNAVHDISDGGLIIAGIEMAMAGGIGCAIALDTTHCALHALLFGEDQGRYLVTAAADKAAGLRAAATDAGIPLQQLGKVGGSDIVIDGITAIPLAELTQAHEDWLPELMRL
ncbi:MAG TPA: phosphoribosylformylglycinamidine synthase subunit PurL [Alphaproteobacteria bacterium]|nr:phosphoribosylformylglycinamidine synthase subunit PurL [Alphaproteobacteria bacterium]